MNNEANKHATDFECWFFEWLFPQEIDELKEAGDEENLNPAGEENNSMVKYAEWDSQDPLESEDIDFLFSELISPSLMENQSEEEESELPPGAFSASGGEREKRRALGEIPIVENRVQTLLKERLKAEIEGKPLLFPWEREIENYQPDYPDVEVSESVPPIHVWTAQMQNLRWGKLSIPTTENVFAQLLDSCQNLVLSDLQEGAKMVRAVDGLFPGQSQRLNDLSRQVLLGVRRDSLAPSMLPSSYEDANSYQQMLLSLLAARDIINSLTLTCSPNQPSIRHQWETAMGTVNIEAEYLISEADSNDCLRIKAQMPGAGILQLKDNDAVVAEGYCTDGGVLEIKSLNLRSDRIYELNIGFDNCHQKPLRFAVCLKGV